MKKLHCSLYALQRIYILCCCIFSRIPPSQTSKSTTKRNSSCRNCFEQVAAVVAEVGAQESHQA